jgi:hypothetical protein
MFLNAIKLFFAKRILRNRQSFKVLNYDSSKNKRLGILISAKEVTSVEQVILYLKLTFPDFSVETLVFSEDKFDAFEDEVKSFSMKDFNLFAEFNSVEVKEFANQDFDVLINYYKSSCLPLALVSHRSKAKTQVGFLNEFENSMILTIDSQPDLPEVFFKTLHQYLTITKLI